MYKENGILTGVECEMKNICDTIGKSAYKGRSDIMGEQYNSIFFSSYRHS